MTDINKKSDSIESTASEKSTESVQLTEEQIEQAFRDERLWKHKRFKNLIEKSKEAEQLRAEFEKQEQAKLEEQKKYEQLAKKWEQKAKELESTSKKTLLKSETKVIASELGAVDPEAVYKLLDKDALEFEGNEPTNLREQIESLLESKSYLKKQSLSSKSVGSGSNPTSSSDAVRKFKHSQLKDPHFFRENRDAIMLALKYGQIEDD